MSLATLRDLLGRAHRRSAGRGQRSQPLVETVSADPSSGEDLRRCAACGRVFPLREFRPRATTGRTRRRTCRLCEREIARRNRGRARGGERVTGGHEG